MWSCLSHGHSVNHSEAGRVTTLRMDVLTSPSFDYSTLAFEVQCSHSTYDPD